jgi:hypothetical protein
MVLVTKTQSDEQHIIWPDKPNTSMHSTFSSEYNFQWPSSGWQSGSGGCWSKCDKEHVSYVGKFEGILANQSNESVKGQDLYWAHRISKQQPFSRPTVGHVYVDRCDWQTLSMRTLVAECVLKSRVFLDSWTYWKHSLAVCTCKTYCTILMQKLLLN